jgi:ribosomal-protein-alanine N-acetyltransferase
MAESPRIETERLRIESFTSEYLTEKYVSWLTDSEVVRFSEQRHARHTLESCRSYWSSFSGTPNFLWALVAKDPAIGHFGNITSYVDQSRLSADIGILIGEKRVWNKGYGREAWIAVCQYLFEEQGICQITAGTLEVNKSMIGIMNAIGMIPDPTRSGKSLYEGENVEFYYAVLSRSGFLSKKERKIL